MTRPTIILAAFSLLGALGATAPAEACTCITAAPYDEGKNFREQRRRARMVFVGTVVGLRTTQDDSYLGVPMKMNHTVATFSVARAWKGPKRDSVEVHFRGNPDSALCDYSFEAGVEYLVFAYGKEPTATICDYTTHLGDEESARTEKRLGRPSWRREQ